MSHRWTLPIVRGEDFLEDHAFSDELDGEETPIDLEGEVFELWIRDRSSRWSLLCSTSTDPPAPGGLTTLAPGPGDPQNILRISIPRDATRCMEVGERLVQLWWLRDGTTRDPFIRDGLLVVTDGPVT